MLTLDRMTTPEENIHRRVMSFLGAFGALASRVFHSPRSCGRPIIFRQRMPLGFTKSVQEGVKRFEHIMGPQAEYQAPLPSTW